LKLHKNETKEKVVIIELSRLQNVQIPQKFMKKKNVVGASHWRKRKETHHLNFSKQR
jgi:hypothetical protein